MGEWATVSPGVTHCNRKAILTIAPTLGQISNQGAYTEEQSPTARIFFIITQDQIVVKPKRSFYFSFFSLRWSRKILPGWIRLGRGGAGWGTV